MAGITDAANNAFRDFVTDGVAASGPHEPVKSEIRAIFPYIESALADIGLLGAVSVAYATLAELLADTGQADGTLGLVYADPDPTNNLVYIYSTSGSPNGWIDTGFISAASVLSAVQDAAVAFEAEMEAGTAAALAAIDAAKVDAQAAIAAGEAAALAAIEAASQYYDFVDFGFDNGRATTDENGWTLPGTYFSQEGVPGPVRREIIPGVDYSALPGSIQIAYPDFPFEPTFSWQRSSLGNNDTTVRNLFSETDVSANLVARPTGAIRNNASNTNPVRTPVYAIGPQGEATATRFVYSTTSGAAGLFIGIAPAINYEANAKVKGVTAATVQNLRRGASPSGLTAFTASDAGWTDSGTLYTFTGDGLTSSNFTIQGNGSNTPDILLDEIQVYPQGQRPTFASELANTPFNWHLKKRAGAGDARFGTVDDDGFLFTGGACLAEATVAGFPGIFGVVSIWVFVVQETTGSVANASWVCTPTSSGSVLSDPDISPATTANTFSIGTAGGEFATFPTNTGVSNVELEDAGPVILGNVVATGFRGAWLEEIPLNVINTSFAGFSIRSLLVGGSSLLAAVDSKVVRIVGGVGQVPTTAQIAQIVAKLRYDHAEFVGAGFRNMVLLLGDSNQAGFGSTPSAGMLLGEPGEFTPNMFVLNRAISGSSIGGFESRLDTPWPAKTWVHSDREVIEAMLANGRRVQIVQTISFANDLNEFDNAGRAALYARYKALWEDLLAIEVEGNQPYVILLPPWDSSAATTENHDARTYFYDQLDIDVPATPRLSMVDARPLSVFTHNATDYYDAIHLKGDSPGNGQGKIFTPLRVEINANKL